MLYVNDVDGSGQASTRRYINFLDILYLQRQHSKAKTTFKSKDDIQKAKMTFKTIKKALVLYTHMQRRHSKAKMTFKMQREHLNPFLKSILYKIFSLVTHEKYQQQQQ
jgi:hypothetical protein